MSGRAGSWIQTWSGAQFWPLDPHPDDVRIGDIAHALSMICRFNGHCREFYSVAQHSVLVSRALPLELRLWGLLHDAPEAYISDVSRPVKPYLVGYAEIEGRIMDAVCERFGLYPCVPPEVKRVDAAILADEAAALMGPRPAPWALSDPPLGINITPWPQGVARESFMTEFHLIAGERAAAG